MLPLTTRETIVDLNQLYFDHQILLMRAAGSPVMADAALHLRDAARIAGQIGGVQRAKGASAEAYWNRPAANDHAPPAALRENGA